MTLDSNSPEMTVLSLDDEVLVKECLNGNRHSWAALVHKYKNLIFSIPLKFRLDSQDAEEIFQSIWATLLRELPQIREPRALAAWLIRATVHECIRYRKEKQAYADRQLDDRIAWNDPQKLPDEILADFQREQILRQAVDEQSEECRRLISLLFLEVPPVPYAEAARTLGIATGSVGATRARCLEKLRRSLEKMDFR